MPLLPFPVSEYRGDSALAARLLYECRQDPSRAEHYNPEIIETLVGSGALHEGLTDDDVACLLYDADRQWRADTLDAMHPFGAELRRY